MRSIQLAAEQFELMGGKAQITAAATLLLALTRSALARSDGRTVEIVATVEETKQMLDAIAEWVASVSSSPPPVASVPAEPVALRPAA